MRQVTIHLAEGQTDRDLLRELLVLNPAAQARLVGGRHGRVGVLVDAATAAAYLTGGFPAGQTVGAVVDVEWDPPQTAAITAAAAVVEVESVKKAPAKTAAPAAKKAAKKAAPVADKSEGV